MEQTYVCVSAERKSLSLDLVALSFDGFFCAVNHVEDGIGLTDESVVEAPCFSLRIVAVVGYIKHTDHIAALEDGEVILICILAVAVAEVRHHVGFTG